MKLKVVLGQGQTTWTLKPERKYVVFGGGGDCDITLPQAQPGDIADRHVAFSFNTAESTWYIEDLGSTGGTYIDDRPISRFPILQQTQIAIANKVFLFATPIPLVSTEPNTSQSPSQKTYSSVQTSIQQPVQPPVYPPIQSSFQTELGSTSAAYSNVPQTQQNYREAAKPTARSFQEVLEWREYVEVQVAKHGGDSLLRRMSTRFYLGTGLRNTPWIKGYLGVADEGDQKGANFKAFDGYIIPNFQGNAKEVATGIAQQLHQLKQYEDTDCYVINLTDAHIVDSATQSFTGIELFPVKRGGIADWRKFCVVSYHRTKTYLLVENYGTDLFVSWITRFEPIPTAIIPVLWMGLAICIGFSIGNFLLALFPIAIWSLVYLLLPLVMSMSGILPKKANAMLFLALIFLVMLLFFNLII